MIKLLSLSLFFFLSQVKVGDFHNLMIFILKRNILRFYILDLNQVWTGFPLLFLFYFIEKLWIYLLHNLFAYLFSSFALFFNLAYCQFNILNLYFFSTEIHRAYILSIIFVFFIILVVSLFFFLKSYVSWGGSKSVFHQPLFWGKHAFCHWIFTLISLFLLLLQFEYLWPEVHFSFLLCSLEGRFLSHANGFELMFFHQLRYGCVHEHKFSHNVGHIYLISYLVACLHVLLYLWPVRIDIDKIKEVFDIA